MQDLHTMYEEWLTALPRILAAVVCSAVLGLEREFREKPAGLRTNMLVGLGAALATLAAVMLTDEIANASRDGVTVDPIRIISGVVGGIGFLGAGAIIQSRGHVEGVTTAATIWVVGGIGIACGLAMYALALTVSVTALIILVVIGTVERRVVKSKAGPPPRGED